jgi:DNA-binding NtrC family response regulator
MTKPRILFVDDEEHIVSTLRSLFRGAFDVSTATSGAQALGLIMSAPAPFHVVVSDQRMPEMQGIELLREVRKLSPITMRIMLTGYADLAAIVGSINDGEIYRYIYKPWNNKDVVATITAAAETAVSLSNETPIPVTESDIAQTGILVIDDSVESHVAVKSLFASKCRVFTVTSCAQALDMLEREPIGVVVSDVFVDRQDITQLLKILKAQHPHIVSVVLTKYNDTSLVVDLINHGQIFRFLGKPAAQGQLRVSIEAALTYHARLRRQPKLLSRHRVENPAPDAAAPALTTMIMSRLKSLREAFAMR